MSGYFLQSILQKEDQLCAHFQEQGDYFDKILSFKSHLIIEVAFISGVRYCMPMS